MSTFEERVAKTVSEKMNDGTVEKLVADAAEKALKESINEQFRWNGEAKKIIDEKVKAVMIQAIENVDLNDHVVKLDTLLTEIVNSTSLIDNKVILENFKELMTEPDRKEISVEEIFEKYKEFVSEEIDTSELEIDYDDRPTYQFVTASVETDYRDAAFATRRYCDLIFKCEEDEKLEKTIHLYENSALDYQIFRLPDETSINSLRSIDKFDVFMLKLDRSFARITGIRDMLDDEVEVKAEPEATFI